MLTRCPDCQTLFRIRAETLRVAQGRVRCGRCGSEFNALDSLAEDPDDLNGAVAEAQEAAAQAADPDAVAQAADMTAGGAEPQAAMDGVPTQAAAEEAAETFVGPLPEAAGSAAEGDQGSAGGGQAQPVIAPELIHSLLLEEEPRRARAGPRLAAALVSLVLLAALAGQWAYLQRAPLYDSQPPLRPVLERMCLWLGCDLPLARAPERIEIVERVVREHPRVAQALLVDLTFVSRAEGRIAYPLLELRLADLSGNRIAARRFTPTEYLPRSARIAAGLPANLPVQVTLELLAPDLDVVSFQFDFL